MSVSGDRVSDLGAFMIRAQPPLSSSAFVIRSAAVVKTAGCWSHPHSKFTSETFDCFCRNFGYCLLLNFVSLTFLIAGSNSFLRSRQTGCKICVCNFSCRLLWYTVMWCEKDEDLNRLEYDARVHYKVVKSVNQQLVWNRQYVRENLGHGPTPSCDIAFDYDSKKWDTTSDGGSQFLGASLPYVPQKNLMKFVRRMSLVNMYIRSRNAEKNQRRNSAEKLAQGLYSYTSGNISHPVKFLIGRKNVIRIKRVKSSEIGSQVKHLWSNVHSSFPILNSKDLEEDAVLKCQ